MLCVGPKSGKMRRDVSGRAKGIKSLQKSNMQITIIPHLISPDLDGSRL